MLTAVLRHVRRQAVGYIALFVALGGVGYAAIPDSSGVVHGCYDTTNQTNGASPLYVIDTSSTSSCPQGRSGPMTALNWNATGPTGPQGQQGQQGPQGKQGPPGTPGINFEPPPSDLTPGDVRVEKTVSKNFGDNEPFGKKSLLGASVRCPAKFPTALNGGWRVLSLDNEDLTAAALSADALVEVVNTRLPSTRRGSPEGWVAQVIDLDATAAPHTSQFGVEFGWQLRVWALCGPKKAAALIGVPLVPPVH